jgi:predicted aspartyl protease
MRIHYDGSLLTITLSVVYRGKTMQIEDVIVDTGSSHTILSPDVLEQIGVTYENGDPVYEAYGIGGTVPFYTKVMDEIIMDTLKIKQIEVDVGMLPKSHKGLLGLDILKTHGFIVDLEKLELRLS